MTDPLTLLDRLFPVPETEPVGHWHDSVWIAGVPGCKCPMAQGCQGCDHDDCDH